MTSPGHTAVSRLSLCSIGVYLLGIGIVASVQIGLQQVNRNPFPLDGRVVLACVLLPVILAAVSVEVGRREMYGPAALVASVVMPIQFVAAFATVFAVLYSLWCCLDPPILPVAFIVATVLFAASGLVSVVVARGYLDLENSRAYVAHDEVD